MRNRMIFRGGMGPADRPAAVRLIVAGLAVVAVLAANVLQAAQEPSASEQSASRAAPAQRADLRQAAFDAGDPGRRAVEVAGLKDQLEKGLKARLPNEFQFIARVVRLVETGRLKLSIVMETFHWVRKNRGGSKYLVPYFERVLKIRALQEQGIRL